MGQTTTGKLTKKRVKDKLISYHGTSFTNAENMAGKANKGGNISVSRGGGEFGKGFYTQNSSVNAMKWAISRNRNDPAILAIDVDILAYNSLKIVYLDDKKSRSLNQRLRKKKTTIKYIHDKGCDVIEGRLNSSSNNNNITQYKFESIDSQNILNGNQTTRSVR